MNCVHGIDSRFCAVCNKASVAGRPRSAIGSVTLAEILEFLSAVQVRATYGAVGEVIGVNPRSMGASLGGRSLDASWIVNAGTGLPTDYSQSEMHPSLQRKAEIISSGIELVMRLTAWRAPRSGV